MKGFFGDKLLLNTPASERLYEAVKELPIIDYHCHLNEEKIAKNTGFSDIGELWLSGDHYKWRAMRLCGVEEKYITGDADYKEKFLKYAEILPNLAGNPLYYWTHMELKQIFDIREPLNENNALRIYERANERLKDISVWTLLEKYKVQYIATTDDPVDDLENHGKYANTEVRPTFRPDKALSLDEEYLEKLGKCAGMKIECLEDLLRALEKRLNAFVHKGCRISDHGFECFPEKCAKYEEARSLFNRRQSLTAKEKDALFGFLLKWLGNAYKKRGIVMQLHFSAVRNNNAEMYKKCGPDSGFDLIGEKQPIKNIVGFLNEFSEDERPETVLYTLNDNALSETAVLTGAFRHVRLGAAWWFNDTVEGIRKNLKTIAEYSALGNNLGMLTDSRSFSSYVRFDFFRRILCDYLGELCEKGEYEENSARKMAENICYYNIKELLKL